MQVGFASVPITPDRLLALQGQMHLRMAQRTRDPLLASALALADPDPQAVLVHCDLCMIPDSFVATVRELGRQRWGIDPARVLIAASHTHVGPCMVPFRETQIVDEAYLDTLRQRLVEVVGRALEDMQPCTLHGGSGWIEHMGWNRRGRHAGVVDMYHGSWRPDFEGTEGPRDGQVPVIVARRGDGSIKALLTGFASHPNCVEGEQFYSADFPGEMRRAVQQVLGPDVGVVYLTGAAGNTAPSIMEHNPQNVQPWRGEAGVVRSGRYLAAEVIKTAMAAVEPMARQTLACATRTLHIPVRPWNPGFDPRTRVRSGPAQDYYLQYQPIWESFRQSQGQTPVRLHVLRLGDAALCTNPAELFVEFGLEIKQHSPAKVTLVAQLTDGYCGYVPTARAFQGGGYETWPAPTSKLAVDAGDHIVAATRDLLAQAFA